MRALPLVVVGLLALGGWTTTARGFWPYGPAAVGWWNRGYGMYGGFGGYRGFASTPIEGYYRGVGDVIRSQGIYNQLTAQATLTMEEAAKQDTENRLRRTEAFYQARRMHDEYSDSAASLRRAETQAYVDRRKSTPPRRLDSQWLDAATGELHWPRALAVDDFAEMRALIQDQFYHRAQSRMALDGNAQAEVTTAAVQMNSMLRDRASKIDPADFVQASRFIRELRGEVRVEP